jgi:hypothetical protein
MRSSALVYDVEVYDVDGANNEMQLVGTLAELAGEWDFVGVSSYMLSSGTVR